jgi:metal-dependent hydrolase (beta-lactamase superfamily II)
MADSWIRMMLGNPKLQFYRYYNYQFTERSDTIIRHSTFFSGWLTKAEMKVSMHYTVTTLVDNSVAQSGNALLGEHGLSLFFLKTDEQVVPDTLADDQALILETDKGLVVLLGCSHRGVINTLTQVARLKGNHKIHGILGGLHLGKASDGKLAKIIDHLRGFDLKMLGVGHCTGPRAFLALANAFKDCVFHNTVGNVIEF